MALTDFLLARIAEDESCAMAEAVSRNDDPYDEWNERTSFERRFSPVKVLAECVWKRRVIVHALQFGYPGAVAWGYLTALAGTYAYHPDYQQEWADELDRPWPPASADDTDDLQRWRPQTATANVSSDRAAGARVEWIAARLVVDPTGHDIDTDDIMFLINETSRLRALREGGLKRDRIGPT